MSRQLPDPIERTLRVRMRDQWYERLYLRAAELRMQPEALASQILERAVRRWKVDDPSLRAA
jgi:hypothetical protein